MWECHFSEFVIWMQRILVSDMLATLISLKAIADLTRECGCSLWNDYPWFTCTYYKVISV